MNEDVSAAWSALDASQRKATTGERILNQKFIEVPGTRSELVPLDAQLLKQRDEEIAEGCLLAALFGEEEMAPMLETAAGEHQGQVGVRVCAGIAYFENDETWLDYDLLSSN